MNPKESALHFCEGFIEERLARLYRQIDQIKESLVQETKSSAGDKHETGRAMLQLEREKLGQQLLNAEKIKQHLSKVNLKTKDDVVGLGSLVYTTKANYFLSISAGAFKHAGTVIFCISPSAPIGKALLGKHSGNTINFNSEEITIHRIV